MRLLIEPTQHLVELITDSGHPVQARAWKGVSDTEVPVLVFMARLEALLPKTDPRREAMETELFECAS
jgi:hypothetical protein